MMNNSNEFIRTFPKEIRDIINEPFFKEILDSIEYDDINDETQNSITLFRVVGEYVYNETIKIFKKYNNLLYYDLLTVVAKETGKGYLIKYSLNNEDELQILNIFKKIKKNIPNEFDIDYIIELYNDKTFKGYFDDFYLREKSSLEANLRNVMMFMKFLQLKPDFENKNQIKEIFAKARFFIKSKFLDSQGESDEADMFEYVINIIDEYERLVNAQIVKAINFNVF
jgi:hypothetical protein